MKVLVTGAAGFTGKALTLKLCQLGLDIRILVRDKSRLDSSFSKKVDVVEGDIIDDYLVDNAVKGVDKVFHIAALFRQANLPDKIYWDVNVKGTENLLKSSLKHGVKKFVHCSTIGVHGHIENPPADEKYRFSPGDIYQVTKLEGERLVKSYHKNTGLPVTIIRPCTIYGAGDLRLLKLFKIASLRIIPIIGNGEVYLHMVYIDDLVNAFILASDNNKAIGESFIIGGPEYVTLNKLFKTIAEILNKPKRVIHLPAIPFQLAGTLCEAISIPFGINPPIYRRRVDFFTKSRAFDIAKSTEILGFTPIESTRTGLIKTYNWYAEQGLL